MEININVNNDNAAEDVSAVEVAESLEACEEGFQWLAENDIETFQEAWQRCHRGDWMLWAAAKLGVDSRTFALAKVECASTVEHLMSKESLEALETARRFGQGRATKGELNAARIAAADACATARAAADAYAAAAANAAYAAARADAAYTYATSAAAYAAACAAAVYADADAAGAAADAAYATAARADATSADAERKKVLLATADICRQMLTKEVMEKVSEWFG